jgi:Skp family chaperone for outer membrane proteins
MNDQLVEEKNKFAELETATSTKLKSMEKELQASREKAQTEKKQLQVSLFTVIISSNT